MTRSLLGGAGEESLATIARAMQKVTRSDFVLVILPAAADTLMIEVAVGEGTQSLPGHTYARAGSVSAEALESGHPALVADARSAAAGEAVRALARRLRVGPLMFVPLVGKNGARGVLAVGRRPSASGP